MFCSNCGYQMDDDVLVCPNCGTKVDVDEDATVEVVNPQPNVEVIPMVDESEVEVIEPQATEPAPAPVPVPAPVAVANSENVHYCHNCGTPNDPKDMFCASCGAPLNDEVKPKKKFPLVPVLIAAGAVIVIALAVIAVLFVVPKLGKKSSGELFYIKDNELVRYQKKANQVIDDDIFEDDDTYYAYSANWYVNLSEDGKYVYYPVDLDEGSYTFSLYYKKYGDPKATPVKVDSDVFSYSLLKDGSVVYIKDTVDRKMYKTDMKGNKEKIASEVSYFHVSDDEKTILWTSYDSSSTTYKMYWQDLSLKKDKVKIDSDIDYEVIYTDNHSVIMYVKDGKLYEVDNFGEKNKIASDVSVLAEYSNGETVNVYYSVDNDDISFMDALIYDDCAEKDSKMKEPRIEDYQKTVTKNTYWGTRYETVTDDSYYDALEEWYEKETRDYLRESLDDDYNYISSKKIYMYSSTSGEKEVFNGLIYDYDYNYGAETASLLLETIDLENDNKVKLSTLTNLYSYEIYDVVYDSLISSIDVHLLVGTNDYNIAFDPDDYENPDLEGYTVMDNRKTAYFFVEQYDDGDDYSNVLLSFNYANSDGALKVISDDCENAEVYGDKLYYIEDANDDYEGDLYVDGELLDSDVYAYSLESYMDGKGIIYMVDRDDNYIGTLKTAVGTKTTKIADDVYTYETNDAGDIAYIVDYSTKKKYGDLKKYKDGTIIDVDTDVSAIMIMD